MLASVASTLLISNAIITRGVKQSVRAGEAEAGDAFDEKAIQEWIFCSAGSAR